MGKGKNKAFKLKVYKVPQEKYVVVVNPWGLPDKLNMNTKLNEIGAWFELLLKRNYPNVRVREIFYQKTHRNIIVELPQEVDINKYIGAYHYSTFHNKISPNDTRTAYIYEYQYARFGNPGERDWTGVIPTNLDIPTGLLQVLKDPFPHPTPAPPPPSDTPYARAISTEIQAALTFMRDAPLTSSTMSDQGNSIEASPLPPPPPPPGPGPGPNTGSSSSFDLPSTTESLFTPYEPPSHYVAMEASRSRIYQQEQVAPELPQVKKKDPYEEEEVEKALLRSRSLSPVKKDDSKEAVDFFNSFIPTKSEEKPMAFPSTFRQDSSFPVSTSDGDGDYKPSAELLELFNTLPVELSLYPGESSSTARKDVAVKSEVLDTVLRHDGDSSNDRKDVMIKSEVVETKLTHDEEYRPSDELLAAFTSLTDLNVSIKKETKAGGPLDLRIKEEPTETEFSGKIPSLSGRKQLPRPSTLRTTVDIPRQRLSDSARYNSDTHIKLESVDFSSNHHYPRDPRNSLLSREDVVNSDPRKRHTPRPIKHERSLEDHNTEDGDSILFRKRLKMER